MDILERIETCGTPLIDGNSVTFAWHGKTAPRLVADFTAWEHGGIELLPVGKNWWAVEVPLPGDAYVEYAFMEGAASDGEKGEDTRKFVLDPLNKRVYKNGLGKMTSYFYMPGARPTPFTRRRPGVPRGKLFSEMVAGGGWIVGEKRKVYFYQPPVDEPCPLVVVWDGQDYLRQARLIPIVDNLIHAGRIRPIALVMPEHGRKARMVEYGACESTLCFLGDRLIPLAQQRLNLLNVDEHPGAYGVIGASLGGLMALFTGLRLPQVFGKLLPQSGAFTLPGYAFSVWDLVRSADPSSLKIWMDAGKFEYLAGCNREMADLLEERGFDGHYHEYSGGHNYIAWRNDLPAGLEYLFPRE